MGLFSGLFGSSSSGSTNSTSTSTSTQTPNVPSWIQSPVQGYVDQISGLSSQNPYSYVAGPSDLQTQAWGTASSTLGSTNPYLTQAGTYLTGMTPTATASGTGTGSDVGASTGANYYGSSSWDTEGALPTGDTYGAWIRPASDDSITNVDLSQYMSPYTNNVVDAAMADWDNQAGQTQAANDLQMAKSGAFGGSGAAIDQALTNQQLALSRQSTLSGLLNNAYTQGTTLANEDLDREAQQRALNEQMVNQARQFDATQNQTANNTNFNQNLSLAQALGNLGSTQNSANVNDLSTLASMGGTQQGLNQQYTSAPLSMLSTETGLLDGLPLNMFVGSTTNSSGTQSGSSQTSSNPSLMGDLGSVAGLFSLFSDVRLKKNIVKVGTRPDGIGVYDFEYVWSPHRYRGAMAQEVLNIKPEAVSVHPSGYLMVNYNKLEEL